MKPKRRLEEEGSQSVTACHRLLGSKSDSMKLGMCCSPSAPPSKTVLSTRWMIESALATNEQRPV